MMKGTVNKRLIIVMMITILLYVSNISGWSVEELQLKKSESSRDHHGVITYDFILEKTMSDI